jgi:hypothetical protein
MPYIKKEKRQTLDVIVEAMRAAGVKADGDLNYILFAFCKRNVVGNYNNYKNFLGELNEASEEIRRRLLQPYEDSKIKENGDVNY